MEAFLPYPGFPQYLIGTAGTVISIVVTAEGRKRATHINRLGYECCILSAKGQKPLTKKVHRLVGETHLPNPLNLPEINHIDHNKANNRLENHEWVTHQQNHVKGRAFYSGNWSRGVAEKLSKPIIATPINGGEPMRWPSGAAWARNSGNPKRAANICKAIQTGQPAYGHTWAFERPQ